MIEYSAFTRFKNTMALFASFISSVFKKLPGVPQKINQLDWKKTMSTGATGQKSLPFCLSLYLITKKGFLLWKKAKPI
ncbi:MAG: hypothetical protein MUF37_07900, partial [Methanoregulaceae archaeon]|nr:hypothetical protein [Methanoregulaceae archaeon]